jgi:hypothetical protein
LKEQTVQGTRPAVLEASTLINPGSRAYDYFSKQKLTSSGLRRRQM